MRVILALEDGTIFRGESFGKDMDTIGEVVFNTGMTGYQEVLTDPSYYGQIVTMTYPLIGNYGINLDDEESINPKVKGFIVKELCKLPSNWRSVETVNDYLKRNNIVGIEGIDTRALTKTLRIKGSLKGKIVKEEGFEFEKIKNEIDEFKIVDAVKNVTTKEIIHYEGKGKRVVVLDLGLKQNIVRSLLKRGCEVFQFPAYSTVDEILAVKPDGIMLSNGPGDPKDCQEIIQMIKELMGKKPIFGICLGHQLTALANGADTSKMKFGHRGCNHPVKDVKKDSTYITSQNHGYAILNESIHKDTMEITHINLNDETIEGIKYKNKNLFTVQFHPEASPGPQDTAYLFDEFMELMDKA